MTTTVSAKQDYMKQYRQKNRVVLLRQAQKTGANKRAALFGVPGILTLEDVIAIMSAGACFYCGSDQKLGLDHVVPMHAGGPNMTENIVCCCHRCNQSKGRADRPGRWSQTVDQCQRCGTNERPHFCKGMCKRCYRASRHVPKHRVYVTAPSNLTCDACGGAFHLKPSAVRKGRGRYCSIACRWQGSRAPVTSRVEAHR